MSRGETGRNGELLCIMELQNRGFIVEDLNLVRTNMPNSDLRVSKGNIVKYIQVKSSKKDRGYITGGSVNKNVVSGSPIFNRSENAEVADIVIFTACIHDKPRFFIVPVKDAERIFRKNVDAYWLTPKLDGGVKKPNGQSDIFVGHGHFPHSRIVPDQREDVLPFEDRWELLE